MAASDDAQPASRPLPVTALTWAALLGRWVEFARSAVALPDDRAGRRLRESVPDLIMLQAVWFALGQLDELPPDERALGLDRAALLIEKHAGSLRSRWEVEPLPEQVRALIDDAAARLAEAEARAAACGGEG
jgi:hypothetical protein